MVDEPQIDEASLWEILYRLLEIFMEIDAESEEEMA